MKKAVIDEFSWIEAVATMPVPMPTLGSTPSLSHTRPVKRGRQRKIEVTPHLIDVNSQLIEAISKEKTSVVHRLISSGADPNTCSATHTRDPALVLANFLPSVDTRHSVVSLLLDKGARVDAANSVGQTALMCVAMTGDAELCRILLDAGASVGIEDCDGNTALSFSAQNGQDETTRMIIQAAKKQGCNIDHRNVKGLTALLLACQNSHLSTARILVQEGGASPSIRDLDNFTTAAEWIQKSGHYSESDLKFLFPVSRKKSHYRQQRQEKGIKTLSDYLGMGPSPTAFTVSDLTERDSTNKQIPQRLSSPASTSHSMFDIPLSSSLAAPPTISSPFRKKSTLPPVSRKGPKLYDFKLDLYQSRYMNKRQLYVSPNRKSGCFHMGSLEPLSGDPLERISLASSKAELGRNEESRQTTVGARSTSSVRGEKKGKYKSLPPLKQE